MFRGRLGNVTDLKSLTVILGTAPSVTYDTVTLGAPTAQSLRFKQGGLESMKERQFKALKVSCVEDFF
jgi:hypothetical protein